MQIGVLGSGSWGTALAAVLAEAGHDVALWGRDPALLADLRERRENRRYLPGRRLPDALAVHDDLRSAVRGRDLAVMALPSASVRGVAAGLPGALVGGAVLVCASK